MNLHFRYLMPVIVATITGFFSLSTYTLFAQCVNNDLATPYAANNGSRGVMFNITAGASPVTITGFDGNLFPGTGPYEIYYKAGSYVGSESVAADWTLAGNATITSNGTNVPTPIPIPLSITIPAGTTYGFYMTATTAGGINYFGAASAATLAANTDITIDGGVGKAYPFAATYTYRHASVTAHYYTGSLTGSMSLAMANTTSAATIQSTSAGTLYSGGCDALIALVTGTGAGSVSGSTVARVWIEGTQPAAFVTRHYQIAPANDGQGRVTLYFTDAEFNSFNSQAPAPPLLLPLSTDAPATMAARIANVHVERRPGSSNDNTGLPTTYTTGTAETIDPNDADIVWNPVLSRWEVTFDVTGFSGFFLKTSPVLLPQQLLRFSGDVLNNGIQLQWQTTGETGWLTFEIERSTDGIHFTPAGSVPAAGSTNRYTYTDQFAISGKVYYRLKMVGIDNQIAYSSQLIFNGSGNAGYVQVYPSPVGRNGIITISSNATAGSKARFTDLQGRALMTITLNHTSETVDISRFPRGLYFLQVGNGAVQKIIKE